jgi:ribosomal protein L11 methyltransferase
MHSLRLRCRGAERDLVTAELYEQGTLGIRETEALEDGLFELEAWFDQPRVIPALASYAPVWQPAPDFDWIALSRGDWTPQPVGRRFWLVPDWSGDPAPEGRLRLVSHSGAASGSGLSDPTQLALEALEQHLRPADTVLDVGTGSGILTSAAWLLGARRILACDIDPDAAAAAARNLDAAGVGAHVFAGSPRALKPASASLIVANLNAAAIASIAGELARVLTLDGRLIVCGFPQRRLREVARGLEARGLIVRHQYTRGDWRCLVTGAVL